MKKILSLLVVGVMAVSMIPAAYATTDYTNGTQVEYTATGSEAYTITVPAQLAPSGSGTVTLSGTWASDRKVTVTADKTVTLVNSINAADTKTLDVTFAGISKAGDNTQARTYTETVSVAEMPADALFGTWSGTFYYNVEIGAAPCVDCNGVGYIDTICEDCGGSGITNNDMCLTCDMEGITARNLCGTCHGENLSLSTCNWCDGVGGHCEHCGSYSRIGEPCSLCGEDAVTGVCLKCYGLGQIVN